MPDYVCQRAGVTTAAGAKGYSIPGADIDRAVGRCS